jgi:hypothetical protein
MLQRSCACSLGASCSCPAEESGEQESGEQDSGVLRSVVAGVLAGRAQPASGVAPPIVHDVIESPGSPLDAATRALFESRLGQDLSRVRLHTDSRASASAQSVGAIAYAVGPHISFAAGAPDVNAHEGRRLLAHELAHTLQQPSQGPPARGSLRIADPVSRFERQADEAAIRVVAYRRPSAAWAVPEVQDFGGLHRQVAQTPAATQTTGGATTLVQGDPWTGPLTGAEWRAVYLWMSRGEVIAEPLTADPDHNADLVASAIFCGRWVGSQGWGTGDPLLCVLPEVTAADPRVRSLKAQVTSRGPLIHWPAVPRADRLTYAMRRLIDTHHYPVNGAAGIVGNLFAESGVLPSRVEGSAEATPMRARDQAGHTTDFSPDEVMNRSSSAHPPVGPQKPGVGLAQWTSASRRSGLFNGDSAILFNMDGQIDYLVSELQAAPSLNAALAAPGVSVNDASDDVVYNFEVPGALLDSSGHKLPRTDPAVQAVFAARRGLSQRALAAFRAANAVAAPPVHP